MFIPGEELFLLEHKIVDRSYALKVDPLKSFQILGTDERPLRRSNRAS